MADSRPSHRNWPSICGRSWCSFPHYMFSLLNSFLFFTEIYFSLALLSLVNIKDTIKRSTWTFDPIFFFVRSKLGKINLSTLHWKPLFNTYINSTGTKNRLERVLICKMHYQVKEAQWNVEINREARGVSCHFVFGNCRISRAQKDHKDFVVYFNQALEPDSYKAKSFSIYSLWNNDHSIQLIRCDWNVKTLIKKSFTRLGYYSKRSFWVQ